MCWKTLCLTAFGSNQMLGGLAHTNHDRLLTKITITEVYFHSTLKSSWPFFIRELNSSSLISLCWCLNTVSTWYLTAICCFSSCVQLSILSCWFIPVSQLGTAVKEDLKDAQYTSQRSNSKGKSYRINPRRVKVAVPVVLYRYL